MGRAAQATLARAVTTIVVAVVIGAALGAVLIAARDLMGGRPLGFWLENVGGPMLAVAFVAGLLGRYVWLGAGAGAITVLVAVALYDQIFLVTDGSLTITVWWIFRPFWLLLAVPFGAVLGGLGGWWAANRRRHWQGLAVAGGAVAGEALALLVAGLPHVAFRPALAFGQIAIVLVAVIVASHPTTRLKAAALATVVAVAVAAVEALTGVVTQLIWG
jgi:hypothetical protein